MTLLKLLRIFVVCAGIALSFQACGAIVINEIMYNPDQVQGADDDYEWVELYNSGANTVNVGGWKLRDNNPQNDPFIIPSNTEIGPNDYLVICSNAGLIYFTYKITNAVGNFAEEFGLGNGDDTVTLLNYADAVVDQVTYNDAYPWPFQADGGGPSLERINPLGSSNDPLNWAPSVPVSEHGTPGRRNSLYFDGTAPALAINEIHYHPASAGDDYEYIELYNASAAQVQLQGWKFTNGISFEFTDPTTIAPFAYLVICKNKDRIRADYGIDNVVGNFAEGSSLNNAGENLVLRDASGRLVDFVPYSDEHYWPVAADGYGPSLECINPDLPNHDQANWTAGTFTRRWVHVETSPAAATGDVLYFYLNGEGEMLLDDVSLVPEGGGDNLIPNGDFESGDSGWVKYGNHSTSVTTVTDAHLGTASMKIVSTGDGGGGDWRNYVGVPLPGLSESAEAYVLSFWAKSLRGDTRLTARLANSRSTTGVHAATDLSEQGFVLTPGTENAAHSDNVPPFIYHVRHFPPVPNPLTSPTITARVVDEGVVASVVLEYDAGEGWLSTAMRDDGLHNDGAAGDGDYGVMLSPQPSYTIVRYRVVAQDDQGAVTVSPDADEMKSTHAYFCYNNEVTTTLPIYFLFVRDENLQKLAELGSRDDYVPGTVVYAGEVYDNVGVRWYGSFSERVATRKKNWRVSFNPWQKLVPPRVEWGNLDSLILLGGDYDDPSLRGTACIREALTQAVFEDAGCAYSATQYVHLQLNGSYYGLMLQMERPDTDYLQRNLRDADGDLYQAGSSPGQPPSNMSVLPSYDDYTFAYDRKTNRLAPHDVLISLIEELNTKPEDEIYDFLTANLDLSLYASYLSAVATVQSWESSSRDYYLFYGKHGPVGSERYLWEVMPWGGQHNWERPSLSVLNGIVGETAYSLPNMMRTRFLNDPSLRTFFADRLRHLLNTRWTELQLFYDIDRIVNQIRLATASDHNYWWPEADSLRSHVAALKNNISARREFLFRWLDGVEGPAQPQNASPADGARYVSWPVVLAASEFSGLPGSSHEASQWQIRSEEGLYSVPIWDSGEDPANKTSIQVDAPSGPTEGRFFWRVRYKDDQERWSVWSDETLFVTERDNIPPSIVRAWMAPEVNDEVAVAFSEPVEQASAETLSNYLLNGQDVPLTASLSTDGLTVTLTLPAGTSLNWLAVSNVTDRASSPNVISPDTKTIVEHLSPTQIRINFQPDSEPTPPNYVKDAGAAFDAGRSYGWTTDVTELALVRKIASDPRLDTLIQFGGEGCAWEVAVPSPARYRVSVWIGDPLSESIYDLAIEGSWAASGLYLPAGEFREISRDADVTDGRLTVLGGDIYKSTRIAYLHVVPIYLDGDADLIDDVWEVWYFGSVEECDPDADPDGDGAPNYEEYLARTDPLSFVFRVTRMAPGTSNHDWLELTWKYLDGSDYMVHWSEDLSSWNVFTPIPADIVVDPEAGTVTWTDKGTAPGMGGVPPGQARKRFYRVHTSGLLGGS